MPQFVYRTPDAKGRLESNDKESALRVLRDMNIDVREIGEEGKDLEAVEPPPAPDIEPGEEQLGKKLLPLLKIEDGAAPGEESPTGLERLRQDMSSYQSRTEATAKIPLDTLTPTMGNKAFLGVAHSTGAHPDAPATDRKSDTISVYRKESFLHGSYDHIRGRINDLLGDKFGQVKHVDVQPDMKGNIVISMVIEHDVPAGLSAVEGNRDK